MNLRRKAQIGNVLYAIMFIFVVGFVLYHLQPTLNAVRLEQIDTLEDGQIIGRMVLYGLLPIIWFFYLILSIILVFISIRSSSGAL